MNNLLWIDVETTGLDPMRDDILALGMALTDSELSHKCSIELVFYRNPHTLRMGEYVCEMHTKNGLLERSRNSNYMFCDAAYDIRKFLESASPVGARWTGVVKLIDSQLSVPLRWKKGRRIFVNSMSDLFHESLTFEEIDRVFAVMAACPQHQFQILTKRAKRMAEYLNDPSTDDRVAMAGERLAAEQGWCHAHEDEHWPLPNVWLGVSVENQQAAERRIPYLLNVPAALRFLSCEPLLGPVDLTRLNYYNFENSPPRRELSPACYLDCLAGHLHGPDDVLAEKIDWVITGAESGPGARPMQEGWVRSLRDQCTAASVPFFYKQKIEGKNKVPLHLLEGKQWAEFPEVQP